jgi:Tetratricopeptide repeat
VAFTTINLGVVAERSGDSQAGLEHSAKAVDLFRELRDAAGVAVALENCGWNALALPDPPRAEGFFRDAIVAFDRLGSARRISVNASGLAAALVVQHKAQQSTQLLAAASSLLEEVGAGFYEDAQEEIYDRAVANAKVALGEEAFAAAWARGEAMRREEIVAFCTAPTDTNCG